MRSHLVKRFNIIIGDRISTGVLAQHDYISAKTNFALDTVLESFDRAAVKVYSTTKLNVLQNWSITVQQAYTISKTRRRHLAISHRKTLCYSKFLEMLKCSIHVLLHCLKFHTVVTTL